MLVICSVAFFSEKNKVPEIAPKNRTGRKIDFEERRKQPCSGLALKS